CFLLYICFSRPSCLPPSMFNRLTLPLYDTASRLQRETAQKIVFKHWEKLRVPETVVRHFRKYTTLAKLRKSTQADCPAAFFEEFWNFTDRYEIDFLRYLTKSSTTLLIRRNPHLREEI
ncbi:unnamed protein product, partial [Brassica rapa subsp. narinosa]